MSDESAAFPGPVRAPRFGLSGKLLVLTILFVMVAEVLIYVPSVANFRVMWLNDRLASAYTAALVLDAAPNGMVSDTLAKQILEFDRRPRRRHEDGHAPAHARDRRHAAADQRRFRHARRQDLRRDRRRLQDDARQSYPRPRDARGRPGADGRRIYRNRDGRAAAAPRHAALLGRHSADVAVDFLHHRGSGLSGAALSVRAADAAHHRQHDRVPRRPGKCRPHHRAVGRVDEIGTAERELATMQTELASMLHQKTGSPRSGLRCRRSITICAICSASAQLFSDRLALDPRSRRAALCAEADARARTRHRVLPIDVVLRQGAGAAAGPQADPARAAGRGSARDAGPAARRARSAGSARSSAA